MSRRFSPYVINALVDTITGGSGNDPAPPIGIYRSGPRIEQFFLDCGLEMRVGAQSRVPATSECLRRAAAAPDGDERIERVVLKVCDPREYLSAPDKATAVRECINQALEPDELTVTVLSGKAHLVGRQSAGAIVEPFAAKVATLDFDTVQVEIARALPNLDGDPEDAVTAACSLVEAVCQFNSLQLS